MVVYSPLLQNAWLIMGGEGYLRLQTIKLFSALVAGDIFQISTNFEGGATFAIQEIVVFIVNQNARSVLEDYVWCAGGVSQTANHWLHHVHIV